MTCCTIISLLYSANGRTAGFFNERYTVNIIILRVPFNFRIMLYTTATSSSPACLGIVLQSARASRCPYFIVSMIYDDFTRPVFVFILFIIFFFSPIHNVTQRTVRMSCRVCTRQPVSRGCRHNKWSFASLARTCPN